MDKPTRWGIVSAGKISNDFVMAIQLLPKTDHQVVAVGARKLEDAQKFAAKFGINRAYDSYEKLSLDDNIDIVYIGAIHPVHLSLCKLMLNAGKPVLCEKPLALNLKQVKEITELARSKGLLFAEGLWSLHFPAWKQMKREIESGAVGTVKMLTVNFGQDIVNQGPSRLAEKEMGGGSVLDLGCYAVMAANDIFNEKPTKIVASGLLLDTGVDEAVFITLHYGRRIAQLNISAGVWLQNNMIVSGSNGSIEVPSFWNASQIISKDKTSEFPLPERPQGFNYIRSEGFVYQAEAMRQSLIKGEKENDAIPLKDSEMIMEIMDEVRRQIGVVYDVD